MNREEMIGNWNVAKGKIKEQWSQLTDDELLRIEGNKDQLIGTIQKKYGVTREEAEEQFTQFKNEHLNSDSCCN